MDTSPTQNRHYRKMKPEDVKAMLLEYRAYISAPPLNVNLIAKKYGTTSANLYYHVQREKDEEKRKETEAKPE